MRRLTEISRVSHRGWTCSPGVACPENTVRAFSAAVAAGYTAFETDIQVTRDGVPVLFHDADGRRMLRKTLKISDLKFSDLQQLPMYWQRKKHVDRVPALEEVLRIFGNSLVWDFEIKVQSSTAVRLIQAVMEKYRSLRTNWLSSEHLSVLRALRSASETATLAWILTRRSRISAAVIAELTQLKVRGIFPRWTRLRELLEKVPVAPKQFALICWTVNNQKAFQEIQSLGVSALMTDFPDKFLPQK